MKGIKNYTWHTKRCFFFSYVKRDFHRRRPKYYNSHFTVKRTWWRKKTSANASPRIHSFPLFVLVLMFVFVLSKLKQNTSVYIGRISELSCASVSDSLRNLSYEKALREFHFHAKQRHIYTIGFALRLALIQRLKGTRKWPIISPKLDNLSVDKRLIRKRKLCHEVIAKGIWQLL